MPKNCSDEEAFDTRLSIIQQGIVIARRIEEQCSPGSENEEPSQSIDASCSVTPAKKRRLVDILSSSTANSSQETVSNEVRVKGELSCYLGYNQPEMKSSPLEW